MNRLEKFIQKDEGLLKHGSILFFALVITSIFNYLFQLYVGRALGPVNYGIFSSLVSILYILSVPAGVINTTITKFVSDFRAKSEHGKIKYLMLHASKRILVFGFGCFILIAVCSDVLASFLHVPSKRPIIILGLVLLISLLYPLVVGLLQGLQDFFQLALNQIAGAGFKLLFGISLVFIGLGVNGALLALFLGLGIAFLLAFIPLRFLFREQKMKTENYELVRYSLPVFTAMLCLTSIGNTDIILVKHFFDSIDAGYYAAASLLAKIIFFTTGAIVGAMFPKVSELQVIGEDSSPLLRSCLFYVGLISLPYLILYFGYPNFVVNILFGSKYPSTVGLIGLFGVGMLFFSWAYIGVMYDLAVNDYKFLYPLVIAAILQVFLIIFFHATLITVVEIFLIINAFLFLGILLVDKKIRYLFTRNLEG
jgi:O-antigen/teichoic acid export membrane protein